MSAVVSGLVGAAVAIGLASLATRTQKAATVGRDGWRALRAGWLINGTVVGTTALSAVVAYFLLSGGSSRPDAATQNALAVLILAAFAVCALYMAWTTYGRIVMWKGNELRVRSLLGRESQRRISDVAKVKKSEMRGEYRITFRDGSRLWFSANLHGANELVSKLPQRAFRD